MPRVPFGGSGTGMINTLTPRQARLIPLGGTSSGRRLYLTAVSDTQIIELDEPEPVANRGPWRAGSLSLVLAPVVVIGVVVSLVVPRLADKATTTPQATATPRATAQFIVTAPYVVAPVGGASAESGDAEILQTQSWTTLGPSYPARGDVAETTLHGAAYVIGGTGTADDGLHVYRYDLSTGLRTSAPDLPISLDHAMAATVDDRVYVFGGYVFGRPTNRVFSLSANDARWIEHTPMPAARAAGGIAVIDERAYIVGGVGQDGNWVKEVWVYDHGKLITGLAAMPTPRDHLAVGTYRGSVCAAGGNGGERAFECYDPVRNEWTRLPDLRKPVIGGRAAEAAGWFWVVAPDIHIFTLDHWHFGPRLRSPRGGGALVTIADVLYVVEGETGRAATMEMLKPQP